MSDHPNGRPKSGKELDAWLQEIEESMKAACAQDPPVSTYKPEPQQSVSKQNPLGNSAPAADQASEHPEASLATAERQPKPRRINPSYVQVAEVQSTQSAGAAPKPETVQNSRADSVEEPKPTQTAHFPPEADRPCYGVYPEDQKIGNRIYKAGVYFHSLEEKSTKPF